MTALAFLESAPILAAGTGAGAVEVYRLVGFDDNSNDGKVGPVRRCFVCGIRSFIGRYHP
jgi:hypothetical protein